MSSVETGMIVRAAAVRGRWWCAVVRGGGVGVVPVPEWCDAVAVSEAVFLPPGLAEAYGTF